LPSYTRAVRNVGLRRLLQRRHADPLAPPVRDARVRARERPQLVLEADRRRRVAPPRLVLGVEVDRERAGRLEFVDRGQPGAALGGVHARAQLAQQGDHIHRRPDRPQLPVRARDAHVDLDVPTGRAVLRPHLLPTGLEHGQHRAPDLPDQLLLLLIAQR
jgi:hypothetical protein